MAWLNDKSKLNFGKYKGVKIADIADAYYIKWLHESTLNIYFTKEVLDRLKITPKPQVNGKVAELIDAKKYLWKDSSVK